MHTENIPTLKIHKLSQEQYDRELRSGNIDPYAIYLTNEDNNSITIDSTLSVSGAAADAKVVGDKLGDLNNLQTTNKTNIISAINEIASNTGNTSGSFIETDPTVPDWAKQKNKPTYTASEVGADPTGTAQILMNKHTMAANSHPEIRNLISDLSDRVDDLSGQNVTIDATLTQSGKAADAKAVGDALDELGGKIPTKPEDIGAQPAGSYLTAETDPTVPSWAKQPKKPTYTSSEVGADASGTADAVMIAHNTATDAHADIREKIAKIDAKIVSEVITMTQAQYNSMTQTQFSTLYKQGVRIIAVEVTNSDSGTTVTYINQVPISVDENGNIFNGVGWIGKTRLSSTGETKEDTYTSTTGYIVASSGAVIRIKGVDYDRESDYVCAYKSDHTFIGTTNGTGTYTTLGTLTRDGEVTSITLPNNSDIAWVRVSAKHDVDDTGFDTDNIDKAIQGPGPYLIVTVDQEIT